MKNLTRKLLTVLLSVLMVLGSTATAFAVNKETDKGTLTLKGVKEDSVVTFYRIVEGFVDDANSLLPQKEWTFADEIKYEDEDAADPLYFKNLLPLKSETGIESKIQKLSEMLQKGELTPLNDIEKDKAIADEENKAVLENMDPGMYIAIVTSPASDFAKVGEKYKLTDGTLTDTAPTAETAANYAKVAKVYNPVLMSLSYGNGVFQNTAEIDVDVDKYDDTATAKASQPKVDKEITGGFTPDSTGGEDEYDENATQAAKGKKTASLGDKIDYKVTVELPVYPADAINKSLWVGDSFDPGLTFLPETLTVNGIKPVAATGDEVSALFGSGDEKKIVAGTKVIKNAAGEVIGLVETGSETGSDDKLNGYRIVFDYDKVKATKPEICYSGRVNEDAKKAHTGNFNTVTFIYSNNPNKGETWDKTGKPNPQEDETLSEEQDQEVVYTYEVALVKTNNKDLGDEEMKLLPGAEFEVYNVDPSTAGAKPIARIITNEKGIATVPVVEAGQYWFKEVKAPAGYTLASGGAVYGPVVANWTSCTKSFSSRSTYARYTSEVNKAKNNTQVGWLLDNVYYPLAQYADKDKVLAANPNLGYTAENVLPAYLVEEKTTENMTHEEVTNEAHTEPLAFAEHVKNTQEPALPSTGGVGTYIFTIAGVAILATAAFMLIFRKREDA